MIILPMFAHTLQDLLSHLKSTLPPLPDETFELLTQDPAYGLTMKDAKTLQSLDDGDRLDYYFEVVDCMRAQLDTSEVANSKVGKVAANWILHELGALLSASESSFSSLNSTASSEPNASAAALAEILLHLQRSEVTLPTAKSLFSRLFTASSTLSSAQQETENQTQDDASAMTTITAADIRAVIERENLRLLPLSDKEYMALAEEALAANEKMAEQVRKDEAKNKDGGGGSSKKSGKVMWFVGWMVRQGKEGRVQPERAEAAIRAALATGV